MSRLLNGKWIKEKVRFKEDRVVAKLYSDKGEFIKSVIIPTTYYPLSDNNFRYFHKENCEKCVDERVGKIFDSVEYNIGRCYTNSERFLNALKENGYEQAKIYVGWMFTCGATYPVHHSWVVLGNSLFDFSDDFECLFDRYGEEMNGANTKAGFAEVFAKFHKLGLSNTERCGVLGVPSEGVLYVGSECEAQHGIDIYNALMKEFPQHDCKRGNSFKGGTAIQYMVLDDLSR